jgi:hypothetical protein
MSEARQIESQSLKNQQVVSPVDSEVLRTRTFNSTWLDATRHGLEKAKESLAPLSIEESFVRAPVPKHLIRQGEEFMPPCKAEALAAYDKAVDELPKGAVKDFYKELGAQLQAGRIDVTKLAALGVAATKQLRELEKGDDEQQAAYAKLRDFPGTLGVKVFFRNDGVKISQDKGGFEFNASVLMKKDGEIIADSVLLQRNAEDDMDQPITKEEAFRQIRESIARKK